MTVLVAVSPRRVIYRVLAIASDAGGCGLSSHLDTSASLRADASKRPKEDVVAVRGGLRCDALQE